MTANKGGRMDIRGFLLARIAEDEAQATERGQEQWFDGGWPPEHVAQIIRECEVKRRFVRDCLPFPVSEGVDVKTDFNQQGATTVYNQGVRLMSTVYSGHPDYQQEWAL